MQKTALNEEAKESFRGEEGEQSEGRGGAEGNWEDSLKLTDGNRADFANEERGTNNTGPSK